MDEVLSKHYPAGGTILRCVLARLDQGGIIKPHVDAHPSFAIGHRIHVPITTNDKVRFTIDGKPHHLNVGNVFEVNNLKKHSVMNKGNSARVTLIFDYIPPENMSSINLID